MTTPAPSFEVAYREYRGLLFAALGRMALQGFVVPPGDASDLVHDFFIDAWSGLEQRYEPQRASFQTYMYAAFVRFARPRIVRLHRFNKALCDPAEMTRLADLLAGDSGPADDAIDLARVHQSIADLPVALHEALSGWLDANRTSERDVARTLGLSRYELRRRLIEALGQITVAMGALHEADSTDRDVAIAVWQDGLTVNEAAGQLGMTSQEVRNACLRNQRRVQQSMALMRGTPPLPSGRTTMNTPSTTELVGTILSGALDDASLLQIESNAGELLGPLAETIDQAPAAWERLPPDQVAKVYLALARGLGAGITVEQEPDPLVAEGADDCRAVGLAFADALVPALPTRSSLYHLADALAARTRPLPPDRLQQLLGEHDVQAAGDAVLPVAAYGLGPMHFVYASDAIGLLLQRAINAGYFPRGAALSVVREGGGVNYICTASHSKLTRDNQLTQDDLVREVATMADISRDIAKPVLDWMVNSAPAVRSLFTGFSASFNEQNVILMPHEMADDDLFQRWSPA